MCVFDFVSAPMFPDDAYALLKTVIGNLGQSSGQNVRSSPEILGE